MTAEWDAKFEGTVRKVVSGLPPEAPLLPDTNLHDHGLDSILIITLIVELENAYEVRFPDESLVPETCRTPGTLWRTVGSLVRS
ncbi:MAG: acyl carrier protein [Pseudonocardiaceae bacterium]